MGIREAVSRSTLADANELRHWRIYAEFVHRLIVQARQLYAREDFGLDLTNTVYALDSTTIDLCLQILSITLFEKMRILQALQSIDDQPENANCNNQLNLFDS